MWRRRRNGPGKCCCGLFGRRWGWNNWRQHFRRRWIWGRLVQSRLGRNATSKNRTSFKIPRREDAEASASVRKCFLWRSAQIDDEAAIVGPHLRDAGLQLTNQTKCLLGLVRVSEKAVPSSPPCIEAEYGRQLRPLHDMVYAVRRIEKQFPEASLGCLHLIAHSICQVTQASHPRTGLHLDEADVQPV